MKLSIVLILYYILVSILCQISISEKITYISTEHPRVTYYNPNFIKYANLTSRRYGRKNPVYYVGLNVESLVTYDNSILVDFYFYELLTNQYKRSFIEMHFKGCDLLEKDPFFGAALRLTLKITCPIPPGVFQLANMTINPAIIPRGFPFTQGRIYANITQPMTKSRVADGYIDMKIEYINKEKAKKLFKQRK